MIKKCFNFSSLPTMLRLMKAYAIVEPIYILIFIAVQLAPLFSGAPLGDGKVAFSTILWMVFYKFLLNQLIRLTGLVFIFCGIHFVWKKIFWGGIAISFLSQMFSSFVPLFSMNGQYSLVAWFFTLNAPILCAILLYLLYIDRDTKNYFESRTVH